MESLLRAVEDEAGELREADAAELRLIDEIRRMGQEALQAWASAPPRCKASRYMIWLAHDQGLPAQGPAAVF